MFAFILNLTTTWRTSPWGVILYLLICFVRPLSLVGAAPVAVLGGHLYGPVAGPILAITGWTLSVFPGYWLGLLLPATWQKWRRWPAPVKKAMKSSRRFPWTSALFLRLLIPWDTVNAVLGNLRLPWRVALATGLLSASGQALAWSLAGAAVTTNGQLSTARVNPTILLVALLISLAITLASWWWQKRQLLQK